MRLEEEKKRHFGQDKGVFSIRSDKGKNPNFRGTNERGATKAVLRQIEANSIRPDQKVAGRIESKYPVP